MRAQRTQGLAAIATAVIVAGLITACSPGGDDATGVTNLTFWTRGAGSEELVDRFNAAHDDIQVTVTRVPGDEYITKLGSAVSSGEAPDLLDFDVIQGPQLASSNVLLDITDRYEALEYKDQLNEAQMDLAQYDGKVYAIPNIAGPSVMMYNKDLFEQAGLDPEKPPTNWAEIKDAAEKITALGNGIYGYDIPGGCAGCLAYITYPLIWASGGQVIDGAPGAGQTTTYASDPAVADAFSFIRDLWTSGVINPADQTQDGSTWGADFAAGKLGILVGTPESYPAAIEAGVDVGVSPIPGKDGGFSTFVGGDLLGITAGSAHADAAWEFVKWMLEPEQQEYVAELALVPTRLDMLTDEFTQKYPAPAAGLQGMTNGQTPSSLAWNAIAGSSTSPLYVAYQDIVFGGADIPTELQKADNESAKLIQQAAQSAGLG